jgi:IS30 family transposase
MLIAFSPARDATMKTFKLLTCEQRCQIYPLSKTSLIALIELKLTGKWSPEQISGWLREDQSIDII